MHSAAVEESSKRNLALPRTILHQMRAKDAFLTDLGPQSVARIAQCSRNAGAKTPVAYAVGLPGRLIATCRCASPAHLRRVRRGAARRCRQWRRTLADAKTSCPGGAIDERARPGRAAGVLSSNAGGCERGVVPTHRAWPLVRAPVVRSGSRGWRANGRRLFTGALIATLRCSAPVRCGALVDERRLVQATTAAERGRETLIQPPRAESDTTHFSRSNGRQRFEVPAGRSGSPGWSWRLPLRSGRPSPPSVAMRPRVSTRSPMSGASFRGGESPFQLDTWLTTSCR